MKKSAVSQTYLALARRQLASEVIVQTIMKGIYKKKPPEAKYESKYDVLQLLRNIKSLGNAPGKAAHQDDGTNDDVHADASERFVHHAVSAMENYREESGIYRGARSEKPREAENSAIVHGECRRR